MAAQLQKHDNTTWYCNKWLSWVWFTIVGNFI